MNSDKNGGGRSGFGTFCSGWNRSAQSKPLGPCLVLPSCGGVSTTVRVPLQERPHWPQAIDHGTSCDTHLPSRGASGPHPTCRKLGQGTLRTPQWASD